MPWIGKEKNFWPWLWIASNRLKARLYGFAYCFLVFWRFVQLGSLRSKRFDTKDSLSFKALSPTFFCVLNRTRPRISRQQWRKCVLNNTIPASFWKHMGDQLYGDTTRTNTANDSVLMCSFAHVTWTKPVKGSTDQVSHGVYFTITYNLEESTKALQVFLCKCACVGLPA